jgi:hypothetical protein
MAHTRPHFLHVGPEKTGTSWLYRMLSQHPDVHVTPVKEIRYFFEAHAYPGEGLFGRLRTGDWHNEGYRDYLKERLKHYLKHPRSALKSVDRLKWDCKFLFGNRSDEWFASLFRCADSKVSGDFSPQTFHLPSEHIARIAQKWPHTKVLLALREPVEWTWSFARMSLIKDRELADVSDSEFSDFFRTHATYYPGVARITEWEEAFPGRFHLLFFDEIAADPVRLLTNVCEFLGLAATPIANLEGISQTKNPGRPLAIPERFRRLLIELYHGEMRQLADRYGGHPREWLSRYDDASNR